MPTSPRFDERYLSQIPALKQLINLGFEYLTPEQALAARQDKVTNVLLEDILYKQLKGINRIPYKGNEYRFSEENLQLAVQRLKNAKYDGLHKTNEAIYEQLILGLTLEQTVEGSAKSFTLRYIDWQDWDRNAFHVTSEFMVARQRSAKVVRLNIVLFVNGIPLAVIQCIPPSVPIKQAILQSIQNQHETYTPKLFSYVQILLGVNSNSARFGTIGTPARFWSVWKEYGDSTIQNELALSIRQSLTSQTEEQLFSGDLAPLRKFPDTGDIPGEYRITEQTKAIYGLCHPKRLLELTYKFTVFDAGIKKIARYQQYFAVKRILSHIRHSDTDGRRQGGIVWHTQGSGKSLTMVMLARSLAEETGILNPRIVLVTDRKDLDKQIKDTFAACGMAPRRAKTGRDLLELVSQRKAGVITTLVHKFDKALNIHKYQDDSIDIFMLIDESHRTQFGSFASRMRQMFPMACYLGFTGTPLMKKEKNNFAKFGGLIDRYTIDRAIQDEAIVPLLYEARHVEMAPDEAAIDTWFERYTQGLDDIRKMALKKKYARAQWLNKTNKTLYLRALDISQHFRDTVRDSGYKGQLVAPDKITALAYHRYLNEIGLVSSEVIISPPGNREGQEKIDTGSPAIDSNVDVPEDDVMRFWREMIKRYGSEAEYNQQITNRFKHGDHPEILIVVDKLQTGFDAPRNTVLYLTRTLRGHTLLQAIARVNRLHEDHSRPKMFGFIVDYVGILGDLDKALSRYSAFEDFDDEDLIGTLVPVQEESGKLPRRHIELRELFANAHHDAQIREMLLRDEALLLAFHERFTRFKKTLDIALSSHRFIADTPAVQRKIYEDDLRRFRELKKTVPPYHVAAGGIDHRDTDHCDDESRTNEMLNTYISVDKAIQLNPPLFISPFDALNANPFLEISQQSDNPYGPRTSAAKANAIAEVAQKVIAEREEWDPAFYGQFSKLIQQVINEFRSKRLSDVEYLKRMTSIYIKVEKRGNRDVPTELRDNENATAFYRVLEPYFTAPHSETDFDSIMLQADNMTFYNTTAITKAAIAIDDIFRRHWKVRFWHDPDAIKQVTNDIDDYLYDEIEGNHRIKLSVARMDEIIDKIMRVAYRTSSSEK